MNYDELMEAIEGLQAEADTLWHKMDSSIARKIEHHLQPLRDLVERYGAGIDDDLRHLMADAARLLRGLDKTPEYQCPACLGDCLWPYTAAIWIHTDDCELRRILDEADQMDWLKRWETRQ